MKDYKVDIYLIHGDKVWCDDVLFMSKEEFEKFKIDKELSHFGFMHYGWFISY